MAVTIRLRRVGANNDVSFRVVATDKRSPRDGKFIEVVGSYDPRKSGVNYTLKLDRIKYWTDRGATISDTVRSMVKKQTLAAAGKAT